MSRRSRNRGNEATSTLVHARAGFNVLVAAMNGHWRGIDMPQWRRALAGYRSATKRHGKKKITLAGQISEKSE